MNYSDRDQSLALAGIFQACQLTQQLARKGTANSAAFAASIASVFVSEADTTEEIFGDVSGVWVGLQLVRDMGGDSGGQSNLELAKYVMALIQLEGRLNKHQDILQRLTAGIEAIKDQEEYSGTTDSDGAVNPNVIAGLADLYEKTLSNLPPRVMINGEQENLANAVIVNKIRAVLLAGSRAAVLWRQVGGRRWYLLMKRKKYAAEAKKILDELGAGRTLH